MKNLMTPTSRHLIIVAGEASGDKHAASLIKEIKNVAPDFTFSGLGGKQMQDQGMLLYEDFTKYAVVGFF